jgi:protein involved in polysaccharide export with SLBB domain
MGVSAALWTLCFCGPVLLAQSLSSPLSGTAGDTPDAPSAAGTRDSLSQADPDNPSLSAAQIFSIMQKRPEIVVELKDLIAETQTAGSPVQADSITDEALYRQIVASQDVRQSITTFLRSRGFVSNSDLEQAALHNQSATFSDPAEISYQQQSGAAQATTLPDDLMTRSSLIPQVHAEKPPASFNSTPTERSDETSTPEATDRAQNENITDEPPVLRQPAPYNLMSLRDLYTQIPDSTEPLKRFGSEVFTRRDRTLAGPVPLDVPIGPDYVLGPGDSITIDLWGGVTQTVSRTVAQDGHVALLEAGDVQLAGLTLVQAQQIIQKALTRQYRDVQVSVSVSRLRTIRIYMVGDVQRPGAYQIASLASPLTALFAAGGPTALGSLRILRHYRGKQLLATIDLYDFLLHGVRDGDDRLQNGDTLVVPPVGPQIAVSGAVRRAAIYELNGDNSLATLLADAGGLTVAASLQHISIERIDANHQRETINLESDAHKDAAATSETIASFKVQDGDRIHIAPIAPNSERVVYLEGHVVRPGRHPFRDGMHLTDLIQSYQDLLPEPATQGEIIRLVPPDLHAETIEFNLPDMLIGNGNLAVQPFDTIRILGRYEVDAPKVEIRGEALRPGSYPLSEGMTAAQLVRMAGGFKRDALVATADLISYQVVNGARVETERTDVPIGEAVEGRSATADRTLKPGDVLTIHQITGWNDIGSSITIEGEVAHPGSYGFQDGERLSAILQRAGGFRETAYPDGAVLTRDQVRDLEEKSRAELIKQIETSSAAARLSPNLSSGDPGGQLTLIQAQQEQIVSRLKSQPSTGRLVIHISQDINAWAGTPADIEVRRGDVLRIPKRPGFVLVSGQVYNASAISFAPGKSAGWYLQHAGGATAAANRKDIFVIRANGSVVGRGSGEWYDHNVLSTRLQPGDVVVVPQKIIGASLFWRNLLSTAQIASSIAITAAVAGL